MFTGYPRYDRYRTLRLTDPVMRGEDVFALQTALARLGFSPGAIDGALGQVTALSIKIAQGSLAVGIDGMAGGGTQAAICRRLADKTREKYSLPLGLLIGQIGHESGFRLGNYSPQRPDGSYDAGVAQRNTEHTPAKDGFNAPLSVEALGANLRKYYDKYAGVKGDRRWALAAGSWNAPAYASFIANEEGAKVPRNETAPPSGAARNLLERYMQAATQLMT